MPVKRLLLVALACAPEVVQVVAYTWPDTAYDVVEEFFWKDRNDFLDVPPLCDFFPLDQQSTSAGWLRTAYHDVATADVAAGTGGLDGSIFYETGRPENIGSSVSESVSQFASFYGRYISYADVVAAGAAVAVKNCGGPNIPFRTGRITALEAGPSGVPLPTDSLKSQTAAFARQGFTAKEMIGLVACGHTMGGVDNEDFPDINPNVGVASFDHTVYFDNNIATTYFNGTTIDPLISGPATSASDARIFASDGNVTMRSFAHSQDTFFSTCASLLERMINTVPKEVKLSEPVVAIPFKPRDYQLSLLPDGTINLGVTVDVFGPNVISTSRVVTMHWNDRESDRCASGQCSALPITGESNSGLAKRNGNELQAYTFSVNATTKASFSSFWFTVDEDGTGRAVTTERNGGGNYPVDDLLLVVPEFTCQGYLGGNTNITGRITVAIRSSVTPSSVTLESTSNGEGQPIPQIFSGPAEMITGNATSPMLSPSDDYVYYSGLVPGPLNAAGCSTQMEYSATIDRKVHQGQILYSGCTSRASTRLPQSFCEFCGPFPCATT
ncbi:Peroxidase [Mycena chlorophos]|uniref:Peroxidase n=1 Tax=Mycena chlorophos TaxID=658473 RepID=A0A8H6WIX3_MYCCL|nr:Peroxidase [Mycena chlorophos]